MNQRAQQEEGLGGMDVRRKAVPLTIPAARPPFFCWIWGAGVSCFSERIRGREGFEYALRPYRLMARARSVFRWQTGWSAA
jgi:hypothetical protein